MNFHCIKCGECCKNIRHIPQLTDFDDGTGVCIHLKNKLCDIYESRPEICNVDLMYEKYFSRMYSKKDFYVLNEKVCAKYFYGRNCYE